MFSLLEFWVLSRVYRQYRVRLCTYFFRHRKYLANRCRAYFLRLSTYDGRKDV